MEDVLEVYARPHEPNFPLLCMDESSMQLIVEVHRPIPEALGHPVLFDDEEVRNGVASIFIEVEPLGGRRKVAITEQRTQIDWALFIEEMLEERYADAEKVEKARSLANRLEMHYTPKHGSWLNTAEIELSVLMRQCLSVRIDCIEKVREKVMLWNNDHNNRQKKVDWQYKTNDARIKLKRLYSIL